MIPQRSYLIYFLVYKNLQLKYKHSLLGFGWSFLHPLFYLLIFSFVFSKAFSGIAHYPLFVISGLIFWIYFSNSCNQLCQAFIRNSHLIKSLHVKKILYPVSEQGSELVSFLAGFVLFLVLMIWLSMPVGPNLLYILPVIALFTVFTFSVGLILGALNVFFRDVGILWNSLNPALFYLSPVAYSAGIIPEKFLFFYKLNPMYHFFYIIRNVLYEGKAPSLIHVVYCSIIAGVSAVIALLVYRKTRNGLISNL